MLNIIALLSYITVVALIIYEFILKYVTTHNILL